MDKKAVLHFLKPTLRKIILVPVLAGISVAYLVVGSGSIIGDILFLPLMYPIIIFELFAPSLSEDIGFAILLSNWYLVACAISAYMDRQMPRNSKNSRRETPFLSKQKFWA